jgi:hypothetical protein
MVNKRVLVKMLVMVLVLGITTVECFGQSIDSKLNGTWVLIQDNGEEWKLIFNNGIYEDSLGGITHEKGTYTTNGNIIILKKTHIRSSVGGGEYKLWSESELRQASPTSFPNNSYNSYQWTYSISGNKLTITEDGESATLIKKD